MDINLHTAGKQYRREACAYVTFLAGHGDYIKGVIGLAKSLRRVRCAYPLIVAVVDDVPDEHTEILRSQGCVVRRIDPIRPADCANCRFAMPYYVINYSKLWIWTFEEYKKIVYLDADMMVFDNIDELFNLPDGQFYAVMDCFCEPTWSHSLQYSVKYCQQCPEKNPWPRHILGEAPAQYFNAGMFVHEPNKETFKQLMIALRSGPLTPFAEQDLLNAFFQKIFCPLPLAYNLVMAMIWRHPDKIDLAKVKVVHYCAAGSKPWRYTGEEENMNRDDVKLLVQKWLTVYNDKTLDTKLLHVSMI